MKFVASLIACPSCGARETGELRLDGNGTAWSVSGSCPSCGKPRGVLFETAGNPINVQSRDRELAGPEPSQVLSPDELVAELDRVLPRVRDAPSCLSPQLWREAVAANRRAQIVLNELLKFSGASLGGRARSALQDELARQQTIEAGFAADAPRIWALEPVHQNVATVPITRVMLRAHDAWVRANRSGAGRLDIANLRGVGERIGAATLSGARLSGAHLAKVDLSLARLDDVELVDCDLSGANLTSIELSRSRITRGSFAGSAMVLATLDLAVIVGCDFSGADLDRSRWKDASVSGATFVATRFGNADLDAVSFETCSFEGADFAPTTERPKPTTRGARFVDCDLRDTDWSDRDMSAATFERCKLAGARGRPAATVGLTVTGCDVSLDGLQARLT